VLVIWDPEDGSEKQQWHFDSEDVDFRRAKEIEKLYTAGTYDQWVAGLRTGEMEARAILLWHMLTNVHPKLQYKDLPQFRVRQLKVEMTVAELEELWPRVIKIAGDEDRSKMEAAFSISLEEAAQREGMDGFDHWFEGDTLTTTWRSGKTRAVEAPKAELPDHVEA
jgi:hypothetical protein